MARLPTVLDFGPRPVAQPTETIPRAYTLSGLTATGQAAMGLGETIKTAADQALNQQATATALERDTFVRDQIRNVLYDPQTGFMNMQGRNAASAAGDVTTKINGLKDAALQGVDKLTAERLMPSLDSRISSALTTIDGHAGNQRQAWLTGAADAHSTAAAQDAIADPTQTDKSLAVIRGNSEALGAIKGWSKDQIQLDYQTKATAMFSAQVDKLATTDPLKAEAYLKANEKNMLPSEVTKLEASLKPAIVDQRARAEASSAVFANDRLAAGSGSHQIAADLFPGVMKTEVGAAGAANAPAAIGVTSPAGAVGVEQAMPATAADPGFGVKPYAYANGIPAGTTPEQVAAEQKRFGTDYLSAMLDRYNGNVQYALMAYNWGPGNVDKWLASDKTTTVPQETQNYWQSVIHESGLSVSDFKGTGLNGQEYIDNISDPEIRARAQTYYNSQMAARIRAQKQQTADTFDRIYGQINADIVAGNPVPDASTLLAPSEWQKLGSTGTALLKYIDTVRQNGGPPAKSDPQELLRLNKEWAQKPQDFAKEDPAQWLGALSSSDMNTMLGRWHDTIATERGQGAKTAAAIGKALRPESASTMMSMAGPQLTAAGVDQKHHPQLYADFQNGLIKWAEANPTLSTDQGELNKQINAMLAQVTIVGGGFHGWGGASGRAYEIQIAPDVTFDTMKSRGIQVNNKPVPPEAIDAARAAMQKNFGFDPTPRQVIEFIAESDKFQ